MMRSLGLVPAALFFVVPVACSSSTNGGTSQSDAGADAARVACNGDSLPCTCEGGNPGMAACENGFAAACACEPPSAIDAKIVSNNVGSFFEAETDLSVAPDGTMAIAWISTSQSTGDGLIQYSFSNDRGSTWSAPEPVKDTSGRVGSDPVLVADRDGNFYLTWLGFRRSVQNPNPTDFALWVAKSSAGSKRFAAPVAVDKPAPTADKPWIEITPAGSIVLTYTVFEADHTTSAHLARSDDGGERWTKTKLDSMAFGNFVVPCTGRNATRLYVTYLTDQGIEVRWSDDDGASWPTANVGTVIAPMPALTTPSCTMSGDDVWIAYGVGELPPSQGEEAPYTEYRVAHSTDGKKWTNARADDKATKYVYMGDLISESPGVLSLTYYAGSSSGDARGSLRRVRSTDGGQTWEKSSVVKAPIQFQTARDNERWLGDYIGTASQGPYFFAAFGDNSAGATHIGFVRQLLQP